MAHTLKYLHRPCKLHTVRYNMREHSEFLITSGALMDFYCDLGGCITQTREPYLVAKIHGFRTQVNDARLKKKNEEERQWFLRDCQHAMEVAKQAYDKDMTVKEYLEYIDQQYDERTDEPRLIAKVPGLNIYLELLGTWQEEEWFTERWWQQEGGRERIMEKNPAMPYYDRVIDVYAAETLNRMAVFYRSVLTKGDAQTYATQETDWQPREDWQEMYDPNEHFRRPDRHGIGFDNK